jgi:hypothetical protein
MPAAPASLPRRPSAGGKPKGGAAGEYARMLEVERLESLAEDMDELGVASIDDVRRKIAALHQEIDSLAEVTP